MDKKLYKKTRYQNIYKRIKTNNYVVVITKPKTTSISRDKDGNRIYDIEIAKKIRDKISIKAENMNKLLSKDNFSVLWNKYIYWCENIDKQGFNTLKKKRNFYNAHFIKLSDLSINKLNRNDVVDFLNNLTISDKQKNEVLSVIKGFFNWCVREEYISKSPAYAIKDLKVEKVEMKYWLPEHFKKFMDCLEQYDEPNAKRTKIFTLIAFILGDRVGETRALTWDSINIAYNTITINHSINYDSKSKDYLSSTKNYQSQRVIDVSPKIIQEILKYKEYLQSQTTELNDIIFYNYTLNKPYSDTALRKQFYKYIEIADVPKIRMYDLRHTYVTLMMSEGWELYHISRRLGHKNYSTTVDKYGHIESKVRKEIAKTTDKYI